MTDFLLELRSEEIPARMHDKARDDLARLFTAELTKSGLTAQSLTTYATPRRLTLIARDLPLETAPTAEETKGPKTSAPPQALEGFLRKTGLTREQLIERDGVLFAVVSKAGVPTESVLSNAIKTIVHKFPWPKSMRWGAVSRATSSLKWVRPLQGIVALFGDDLVEGEIELSPGLGLTDKLRFGRTTVGHRFHHPGPITIGSAADYVEKLREAQVIVDQDERRATIRTQATALAAQAGLELIEDEGLVAENAGLTEWPVPLLGRFDAAFLGVPPEVIQLTARVNQKYFVCRSADGKLANAFICTANIDAADGGAKIVEGNRKVLAARLSDAKFFYDTDLKVPLDVQREKLGSIVFHEKLGTVADKVDRVAKLARWLVEEGIVKSSPERGGGPSASSADGGGGAPQATTSHAESPLHHLPEEANGPPPHSGENREALAAQAERAARLCKADLVTGMVGEFPELQGLMGGYYALAQGEDPGVAEAIRDHYKPVGQGDAVPTAPVTVAVSLADKLDTIGSFYTAEMPPSGSRDPFALRRACLGANQLIEVNGLRLPLLQPLSLVTKLVWLQREAAELERDQPRSDLIKRTLDIVGVNHDGLSEYDRLSLVIEAHPNIEILDSGAPQKVIDFFADRLKVQQREAGVRHDLIDAVFALGGEDDLVRLLARVHALQAFVGTPDGANLLAGYKRAANILKKEGVGSSAPLPGREGSGVGSLEASAYPAPDRPTPDPSLPGRGENKPLSYTPEKDEAALIAALDAAAPRAADAVHAEDFERAMAALATLRAPIDAFFETVTVNDPAPAKRDARLHLLARVRAAVHTVADFSKIEG